MMEFVPPLSSKSRQRASSSFRRGEMVTPLQNLEGESMPGDLVRLLVSGRDVMAGWEPRRRRGAGFGTKLTEGADARRFLGPLVLGREPPAALRELRRGLGGGAGMGLTQRSILASHRAMPASMDWVLSAILAPMASSASESCCRERRRAT